MKKFWSVQPADRDIHVRCDAVVNGRTIGAGQHVSKDLWTLAQPTTRIKCFESVVRTIDADIAKLALHIRPPSINERISEAIGVYQRTILAGVPGSRDVRDPAPLQSDTYDLPKTNTVYVGEAEYHEIVRDRLASWPDGNGVQKIWHLTIIRVRLETYLQVAYVEGVE